MANLKIGELAPDFELPNQNGDLTAFRLCGAKCTGWFSQGHMAAGEQTKQGFP